MKELSIFRCHDIPKNGLHSEIMFPSQFTTSLKSYLESCYIFKFLTCNVQIFIYFNKGSSSSRAIFKSILHVSQNLCHGEGLLIHVTVYNSAFFELSLARYTIHLKLGELKIS